MRIFRFTDLQIYRYTDLTVNPKIKKVFILGLTVLLNFTNALQLFYNCFNEKSRM